MFGSREIRRFSLSVAFCWAAFASAMGSWLSLRLRLRSSAVSMAWL